MALTMGSLPACSGQTTTPPDAGAPDAVPEVEVDDGGAAPGATLPLAPVSGTLNLALFGDGARVVTAWGDPVTPGADGTFTVEVSAVAPQVVVVSGADDAVRGVGLALPGAEVGLGAEDVAAASVFLTPGILSADAAEAQERLTRIVGLDAFPAYRAVVEEELLATPLLELTRGDGAGVAPLAACVAEYLARYPKTAATKAPGSTLDLDLLFMVQELSHSGTTRQIELTNMGWRMLRVTREEGLADGLAYTPVAYGDQLMGGVNGASWGSLFADPGVEATGSAGAYGAAATMKDSVDLCSGPVAYWVQGPGLAAGISDEALPGEIQDQGPAVDAWAESIIAYQLLPLMGVVGGLGDDLFESKASSAMAKEAWGRLRQVADLKGLANGIKKVEQASAGGDPLATAGALLDLTLGIAKYVGEDEIERVLTKAGIEKVGKLGLKQAIKKASGFLAAGDFLFHTANLISAADSLETLPANGRVALFEEGRVAWVEVGVGADLNLPVDGSVELDADAFDAEDGHCWRELSWQWTIDDPDDCVQVAIQDPGDAVKVSGKREGVATLTAETCGVSEEIDLHVGGEGYLAKVMVPGSAAAGVQSPVLAADHYTMVVFGTYTSAKGSEGFINPPADSPAYQYDASWERNTEEGDWTPGYLSYGELWIDLGYGAGPPGMGWRGADGVAGSFSPAHRYEGDVTLFKDGVITFFIGGYHFDDNSGEFEVQIFRKR